MKLLLWFNLVALGYSQHITYSEEEEYQWELFKIEYEPKYRDEEDEQERKGFFIDNLNFVRKHNKKYELGEVSFTVEINKFADWDWTYGDGILQDDDKDLPSPQGPTKPQPTKHQLKNYQRRGAKFEIDENLETPMNIDWRKQGLVTPVKDIGSCLYAEWAFSAVESLEGQNYLKTKKLVSLSAGNVLYCSNFDIENGECLYGGDNLAGFEYMKKVGGIDTDACSPYDPDHGKCTYNATNKAATLSDYEQVDRDEIDLREAVAKIGPVSVSIDGDQRSYYLYKSANRPRKDAFSDRLLLETCQWFKTRVGNK